MIVYGRDSCPFCKKAEEAAKQAGHRVVYWDITYRPDIAGWLMDRYQATTVPQILDGGKYVGGYEDLLAYLKADA